MFKTLERTYTPNFSHFWEGEINGLDDFTWNDPSRNIIFFKWKISFYGHIMFFWKFYRDLWLESLGKEFWKIVLFFHITSISTKKREYPDTKYVNASWAFRNNIVCSYSASDIAAKSVKTATRGVLSKSCS